MTGAELKTAAEEIYGDIINETFFYQILNSAYHRRHRSRAWYFLLKVDQSTSAAVSDTYLTMKTLPTDFMREKKVVLVNGSGLNREVYFPIPFEQRISYKDASRRYYIDFLNSKFALTGNVDEAKTINLFYYHKPADIATGTSPIWPSDFHLLLAFDVAAIMKGGIDYDDQNARMAPENRAAAKVIDDSMIAWDQDLQLTAHGESSAGFEEDPEIPLGEM